MIQRFDLVKKKNQKCKVSTIRSFNFVWESLFEMFLFLSRVPFKFSENQFMCQRLESGTSEKLDAINISVDLAAEWFANNGLN